jgi:hypothetical protein
MEALFKVTMLESHQRHVWNIESCFKNTFLGNSEVSGMEAFITIAVNPPDC